MRDTTKRRLVLYPTAVLVLSGLVYGGFIYEAEPDAETLVNSAEVLAKLGSFDEAIRNGERALAQNPRHVYAHIVLGYAYGEKGDPRATVHYARAVELFPEEGEKRNLLRLYLAEALTKEGKHDEAESMARRVIEADPQEPQAYYVLAEVHRARGKLEDAVHAYRTAGAFAPEDASPRILLAKLEEERGRLDEALTALAEARRIAPDNPHVGVSTARVQLRSGNREQAVAALVEAAKTRREVVQTALRTDETLAELAGDARLQAALAHPREPREDGEKRVGE